MPVRFHRNRAICRLLDYLRGNYLRRSSFVSARYCGSGPTRVSADSLAYFFSVSNQYLDCGIEGLLDGQ